MGKNQARSKQRPNRTKAKLKAGARPKNGASAKPRKKRAQKRISKNGLVEQARADDRKRAILILEVLSREFPRARCMLNYASPLELLIATILASQCTDKRVNEVTRSLFKKYPSAKDYVRAPQDELEEDIKSTGFYRNKAKSIKKCCQALVEKHSGRVPATMKELTSLGGVGRKTANVVLGNAFGIPGIIVDTHVLRLSRRMGLTPERNPDRVEDDLMAIVPKDEWTHFSHLLAEHGRKYCTAKKPLCSECPVEHLCPKIM